MESSSLKWLDPLEEEFDTLFRNVFQSLENLSSLLVGDGGEARAAVAAVLQEEVATIRRDVSGLPGVFSQMATKSKGLHNTNLKLQSLMADSRTELAQARGSCGELRRDLGAQKLHARALDLQLKQVEHDRASCASSASVTSAGAKKIPVLLAELELEIEKYKQSGCKEVELRERLRLLKEENGLLHKCVRSLHSELARASLQNKCTGKELSGRMQQLGLVCNGVRPADLEKLWHKINLEILLQKRKAVIKAFVAGKETAEDIWRRVEEYYREGIEAKSQSHADCRRVRKVTITRKEGEALGVSLTGGFDHGTPLLITSLAKEGPASKCSSGSGSDNKLHLGDAILAVNGQSLEGMSHDSAVSVLKAAGTVFHLDVAFAASGVPSEKTGSCSSSVDTDTAKAREERGREREEEELLRKPPASLPRKPLPNSLVSEDVMGTSAQEIDVAQKLAQAFSPTNESPETLDEELFLYNEQYLSLPLDVNSAVERRSAVPLTSQLFEAVPLKPGTVKGKVHQVARQSQQGSSSSGTDNSVRAVHVADTPCRTGSSSGVSHNQPQGWGHPLALSPSLDAANAAYDAGHRGVGTGFSTTRGVGMSTFCVQSHDMQDDEEALFSLT